MTCLVLIAGLFLLALGVWGWSLAWGGGVVSARALARYTEQERRAFLEHLRKKELVVSDE